MRLEIAGWRWMRTFVVCVGVIGLAASESQAADEVPILALDAGGHTAIVWKVLFTPDGKELITVSDDKTIRFWDVASGEPLRVLRPPVGRGSEGMLYAAALSPGGHTLAVGGYGPLSENHGTITLISLADGQITRLLEGHTVAIDSLAFSHDGRRLISGAGDHTARLWNVATGESEQELKGHEQSVYGVTFSPDGERCATASYDGKAAIWSVATGERLAMLLGHTAEVKCIDWSPDGTRLATGSYDQTVRLWSPAGRLLKTFDDLGDHGVTSVQFTDNSTQLLYTNGSDNGNETGLIHLASGERMVRFTGHTNTIMDGQLSPDGRLAATTGGNDKETFLWRTTDGEQVQKLVGQGRVTRAAAWNRDGTMIAWGNTRSGNTDTASMPLEHAFDLTQLEHGEPVTEQTTGDWRRATIERGSKKLVSSGQTSVDVMQGDQTIATLQPTKDYDLAHDEIRSFTLLPGNRAAVGSNGRLWLYDLHSGQRLRMCVGHTGTVWAVSPSPDGRYLLSASNDMTLRIWNVDASGEGEIEPLLSLFFAGDEWIAWTPQGYYAASPGGERLMGWHVNNGRDQLASFYPASQFHKQFYRPDVIKLLLRTGSVERALEATESGGAITTVAQNLPPQVEIVSPSEVNSEAESEEITVRVRATQTGTNPITSLRLLLDGRPLEGRGGIIHLDAASETVTHRFYVPLVPGVEHTIQARADSAVNYGLSKEVRVTHQPPDTTLRLPSLYVLAIGVADYDDETLKLDFADDDARRLAKTLQERAFGLYETIDTRLVVDKDATRTGILKGLSWLKKQMTQHDVGVLFFSGHGAKDETGNFYLLPSDVDLSNDLLISAVPDANLKSVLQSTPGRMIVMLDACHAGKGGALAEGVRRKSSTPLTDDIVRDLSNDDYGVMVMASSMGSEFSLESPDNQSGMFTLAICEGLAGKADYNNDTHVYFNELDTYVSDRVKELTDGKQHPVTAKPTTIRPFPLTTRESRDEHAEPNR